MDASPRSPGPDPWSVVNVAIDSESLDINRLQVATLSLRLPDGTLIDSETSDWLPAARGLDDIPTQDESIAVLAGVALMDAQGNNCIEPDTKPARLRRFVR